MIRRVASIAGMLLWGLCGAAHAAGLDVADAWIRAAPPGMDMLAGYARLSNPGPSAKTVVGFDSPAFAAVELHRTAIENGVSRMRPVPRLPIAPGDEVELRPGGLHLMLISPARPLAEGDRVPVRVLLEDGETVEVEFPVAGEPPR